MHPPPPPRSQKGPPNGIKIKRFKFVIQNKGLVIIYGIYRVGKNKSRATKFLFVICTGYEIYLAQKIRVKNFFSFCRHQCCRKIAFQIYNACRNIHTQRSVHKNITCLQQSQYFGICFVSCHVMPTYCKITSSSTIVSLYCHLKIDLSSRHEQTKLIYMPSQKPKVWCKLQKITK